MEPQSAYARGFIFGIKRPSEDARTSITEADRQRLNEEFGRGRSSPWWEWYRDVDSRYRDWEGEVLMEIYEKDPAIDFYLNRLANRGLLEFVRQAAAIVERALGRE
jgi:hypothetical protein